jgi:glycosyltransferase involved in cell wall biosynthesis
MKNVVFLVKTFTGERENAWLSDELIYAFADDGYVVDVFLVDLKGKWGAGRFSIEENITLHSYDAQRGRHGMPAQLLSIYRALNRIKREIVRRRHDLVVNFSIASLFRGVTSALREVQPDVKSLLILWDFFPVHQVQIGKIPNAPLLENLLYRLESREIRSNAAVGLMSMKNVEFFRNYHPRYTGKTFVLPLWGGDYRTGHDESSCDYDPQFDNNMVNFVFGGQLSRGRGIEILAEFIELNRELSSVAKFHFYGDGELYDYLKLRERRLSSGLIAIHPKVTRDQYRSVLRQADVGIVITVPNVTVPSFPSKVVDYMICSVPVLSCVETSSDFGSFVEADAQCGYSIHVEDAHNLRAVIDRFVEQKQAGSLKRLGVNGRKYYEQHMTTRAAMRKIQRELQV